jgi:hypothetical protein
MEAYAKALYDDQHIIAEVVDSPLPMGDPATACFPTDVYRLFQTDPVVYRLIKECESYQEALDQFDAILRDALKQGFVGVKCHVLEVNVQPALCRCAGCGALFQGGQSGGPPCD